MTLYACGSNGSGQLGLGILEDQHEFVQVMNTSKPLIAGGGNHTVLIADGKALVSGQVGSIDTTTFMTLKHPSYKTWVHCGAGWEYLMLADTTTVYTLGKGERGQLGINKPEAHKLTKVHEFESPIAQLSCGPSHTVVRLKNGDLYGWGYNRLQPLGFPEKIVHLPTKLPVSKVSQVACGNDYTLYICDDGIARGWGKKATIEVRNATELYAGWSFYGIKSKRVDWFGNNALKQLEAPPNLESIAVGSEHGIGLKNNEIVTWGWGEHGNCPPPFFYDGEASIYGGCATSWIWTSEVN